MDISIVECLIEPLEPMKDEFHGHEEMEPLRDAISTYLVAQVSRSVGLKGLEDGVQPYERINVVVDGNAYLGSVAYCISECESPRWLLLSLSSYPSVNEMEDGVFYYLFVDMRFTGGIFPEKGRLLKVVGSDMNQRELLAYVFTHG